MQSKSKLHTLHFTSGKKPCYPYAGWLVSPRLDFEVQSKKKIPASATNQSLIVYITTSHSTKSACSEHIIKEQWIEELQQRKFDTKMEPEIRKEPDLKNIKHGFLCTVDAYALTQIINRASHVLPTAPPQMHLCQWP